MSEVIRLGFRSCAPPPSYDYIISQDGLEELPKLVQQLRPDRVLILADENISAFYDSALQELAWAFESGDPVVLPSGECTKRLDIVSDVLQRCIQHGLSEDSVIVAIGGGVLGNLATFVAGTYFRGIRHVQVPTTLMSMADSSIGHKGAVNVGTTKNACGLFHPPEFVFVDLAYLDTLPRRHLINGLAEILKHAVVEANELLVLLSEIDAREGSVPKGLLRSLLVETLRSRMRLSADDLCETRQGALLQCGHGVGRALELIAPDLLHGEAVAIGLVVEAELAVAAGLAVCRELPEKLRSLASGYGLPVAIPDGVNREALVQQLASGRHHTAEGGVRFALISDIGKPLVHAHSYWHEVRPEVLRSTLSAGSARVAYAAPA